MTTKTTERNPIRNRAQLVTNRALRWSVAIPRGLSAYWIDMLQRTGVAVTLLGESDARGAVAFCAGVDLAGDVAMLAQLRALRDSGVPLVVDAAAFALLTGRPARVLRASRLTGVGRFFDGADDVRMPVRIAVPGGAKYGCVAPQGVPAIAIDEDGNAPLIGLPLPAVAELDGAAPRVERFPLPRGRSTVEIVSGCDHGGLRRLVENALRIASHAAGLPFVRFAPAPGNHIGAFAMRVDADSFEATATTRTLEALARGDVRATWFIDVERHARRGGVAAVREIVAAGHEVQSHGWRHYTYRSRRKNRANLARSIEVLSAWGVEATAFAAPFGTWNAGLDAAMRDNGIAWSSEFSRCHDDAPGAWPHSRVHRGAWLTDPPWQVPVHPVCPGMMFVAGLSADEIHEHCAAIVTSKLVRGEPAVLYGHPIGDLERLPELFTSLDRTLTRLEDTARGGTAKELTPVWQPTLSELCAFHRARRHQAVVCRVGTDHLEGEVRGPAGLWIDLPDGTRVRTGPGRFVVRFDESALTRRDPAVGNESGGVRRLVPRSSLRPVLARMRIGVARWKREVMRQAGGE